LFDILALRAGNMQSINVSRSLSSSVCGIIIAKAVFHGKNILFYLRGRFIIAKAVLKHGIYR